MLPFLVGVLGLNLSQTVYTVVFGNVVDVVLLRLIAPRERVIRRHLK